MIGDEQRVGLEALAVACLTLEHEVGHELHLHGDGTLTLTLLASAPLAIEGEVACCIAQLFGERLLCEELAYLVIGLEVGDGVRAR